MVSRAGFPALLCSSLVLITWSLLSSALQLEGARTTAPACKSELPLWGSETHGAILIEGKVSICPHKGSKLQEFLLIDPRWGLGWFIMSGGRAVLSLTSGVSWR